MVSSLRFRFFLPTALTLLATVVVISLLNAWLATRGVERLVEQRLREITAVLTRTNFPLNNAVLEQTAQLTGVQLAVVRPPGAMAASEPRFRVELPHVAVQNPAELRLRETTKLGDETYFYAALPLQRRGEAEGSTLRLFFPEREWQEFRREAFWPPLFIGSLALLAMMAVTYTIAARVVRPLGGLKTQVERIGGGDYEPFPLPARHDEIHALAIGVNRLAEKLGSYETDIRKNERLQTLSTLGSGISHQIRNAATGCRMAVELHEQDCPARDVPAVKESFGIAHRQLELIESYVQRFLSVGRNVPAASTTFELNAATREAIDLVAAMAKHRHVEIEFTPDAAQHEMRGDAVALQQATVNVLTNAVEAAALAAAVDRREERTPRVPRVDVTVRTEAGATRIEVRDNGDGPARHRGQTVRSVRHRQIRRHRSRPQRGSPNDSRTRRRAEFFTRRRTDAVRLRFPATHRRARRGDDAFLTEGFPMARVLVVDDEQSICWGLEQLVQRSGHGARSPRTPRTRSTRPRGNISTRSFWMSAYPGCRAWTRCRAFASVCPTCRSS
ncbi:MAG: HAMP domain-containing sensor histidine kinase [Pirellulales bacterium]